MPSSTKQQQKLKIDAINAVEANQPPNKKVKTGKEDYLLNINKAANADVQTMCLSDLVEGPVTNLAGIGTFSGFILKSLKCMTVKQLAEWPYFHAARAITVLAGAEEVGKRGHSLMNVDKMVVEGYENKSFHAMTQAPIHALQGLSKEAVEGLEAMGLRTIDDLAKCEFFVVAAAMVEAAKYEHVLTDKERKVKRELRQLK